MTETDDIPSAGGDNRSLQRHLWAIGLFIQAFSQLEFTIKVRIAAHFSPVHEEFLTIIDTVEVFKLIDGWQRLAYSRNVAPHILVQINSAVSEFKSLNDARNIVAHGLWATDLSSALGVGKRSNKKGAYERVWQLRTADDLISLESRCQALLQIFLTFPSFVAPTSSADTVL